VRPRFYPEAGMTLAQQPSLRSISGAHVIMRRGSIPTTLLLATGVTGGLPIPGADQPMSYAVRLGDCRALRRVPYRRLGQLLFLPDEDRYPHAPPQTASGVSAGARAASRPQIEAGMVPGQRMLSRPRVPRERP